ncbi:sucrase ferredoxin [Halomonas binhaiensis]|uniref:Sucrase ferredoxin n=1 Tax=Halomonas binhaiensis TaxID=2562282 RepID=A0A5C1NIP2_9GAMM|nr:sucrase ferredoxin [Halomonas binhaiensis]QEM82730.1 sucrase ferredoxin [Halomonas binhaiensis]
MSHTFCTELSLDQDDPLAGSAAHVEHNLLISWPRAKWARSLRIAGDMPEALSQRLDAIAGNGRRINLIHRRGMPSHLHRIFLMPERQAFDVPRESLEAFLDAWQAGKPLDSWYHGPVDQDLMLCCTHGKKDKCCAKYGYSAYRALHQAAQEGELPFDVWECTHLGGCRLAASCILLSPVRKYGRITPEQARPLLEHEAQGQRYLPCYRGDSRLNPVQQCAHLAALEYLSRHVTNDVQPHLSIHDDQGDEEQRQVTLHWHIPSSQGPAAQGKIRITCQALTIMRVDTCADLDEGPTPSLVWRAGQMEVVVEDLVE